MNGLFWKKSPARKRSRRVPSDPRGTVSVTRSPWPVVTTPPASRRRRVAPRSKAPSPARLRISARASASRALIGSVAISQRGTSTMSNRLPCRRNPTASSRPGRGALKWGVIFERYPNGRGEPLAGGTPTDANPPPRPREPARKRAAGRGRAERGGDLRAIPERAGRADHGGDGQADPGHVLQELGDLAALPFELLLIAEVLVRAPAATAEEGAPWGDPVGRGREHLDKVRLGVIRVVAEDPGPYALPGERKRDHDDPAGLGIRPARRDPAETEAEVGQRGD